MPMKLQTHRKYDRRNIRKKKVNRRRTYKKRINKFKGGGGKPVYYVEESVAVVDSQIIPGQDNIDIATAQENYVSAGVTSEGESPILFLSESLDILNKLVTERGISPSACILMRTYNVSGATKVLETRIVPDLGYRENRQSIDRDIVGLMRGTIGDLIPTLGLYEITIIEDKGGETELLADLKKKLVWERDLRERERREQLQKEQFAASERLARELALGAQTFPREVSSHRSQSRQLSSSQRSQSSSSGASQRSQLSSSNTNPSSQSSSIGVGKVSRRYNPNSRYARRGRGGD